MEPRIRKSLPYSNAPTLRQAVSGPRERAERGCLESEERWVRNEFVGKCHNFDVEMTTKGNKQPWKKNTRDKVCGTMLGRIRKWTRRKPNGQQEQEESEQQYEGIADDA